MSFPAGAPGAPEWRLAYLKIQRRADAEILAMLQKSMVDIRRTIRALELASRGVGGDIRLEQMRRIRQAMLSEQAAIFRRLGRTIEARRAEAAVRASLMGSAIDELAFAAAGRGLEGRLLAESLTFGLSQTVEVAVVRMTQSAVDLAQRIYRTAVWMDGRVQAKINSALARGLTAREFAGEAIGWFNPNTPGGVRYAAMRLARTEINNAYHAISVNQAADKPWVQGMKWNLSGSHPKPDECDELAHEDKFEMGSGVFPAQEVPRKPHPHCLCVAVPMVVDEEEFLDALVGGRYDGYLARERASLGSPGRSGVVTSPEGALPGLPGSPGLDPGRARRALGNGTQ